MNSLRVALIVSVASIVIAGVSAVISLRVWRDTRAVQRLDMEPQVQFQLITEGQEPAG